MNMRTYTAVKFGDLRPGDRIDFGGTEVMKIESRAVLGTVPGHAHDRSKAAQPVTAVTMTGMLFYIGGDDLVVPTFLTSPAPASEALQHLLAQKSSHSSLASQTADGAIERR